jgi:hypothetical protein
MLGLAMPGDGDGGVVPQPDVFERLRLLAVEKIGRGRLVERTCHQARRDVPHANQRLGTLERQRFEQHTVDDAEDERVGADGGGEGDGGGQRKGRGGQQAAQGKTHRSSDASTRP